MQFHATIYLCSSPLPPRLSSSPSSPRCHSYWYTLGRTGGQHPGFNCLLAHWSRYRGVHTVWFSLSSINALYIHCNMNRWTLTEILRTRSSALFRFIAWVILVTASTKLTKFQYFIILLMKPRMNLPLFDLAFCFKVSESIVSCTFSRLVTITPQGYISDGYEGRTSDEYV